MIYKSKSIFILSFISLILCTGLQTLNEAVSQSDKSPFLVVLGNVQDAGSPHIGCERKCCESLWTLPDPARMVVSLGLIDPINEKKYLFEATPDLPQQIELLGEYSPFDSRQLIDGIFLTHAHIGHYSGLVYLGKEALGSSGVPVFVMPRMKAFLEGNGPWSQLIEQQNVHLNALKELRPAKLSDELIITPFRVPHRDEYSETVGYYISGPSKTAVFIPDIDKWEKWDKPIEELIAEVDYAFLDATFFNDKELPNRNMSEIPHPFVSETMERLKDLSINEKSKVHFIHFNHTNKLLIADSEEVKMVRENGFNIAKLGDKFSL